MFRRVVVGGGLSLMLLWNAACDSGGGGGGGGDDSITADSPAPPDVGGMETAGDLPLGTDEGGPAADVPVGPVDGKWETVGAALEPAGLVTDLVVDGDKIYASVAVDGNKEKLFFLDGPGGAWSEVTGLQIPEGNSGTIPLALVDGNVVAGMPPGYSEADKKIFVRPAGKAEFEVRTVGFINNDAGLADLFVGDGSVYGLAFDGVVADELVTSTDAGDTWTVSKNDGLITSGACFGFASGKRNFYAGDGMLHYCDAGGASCTDVPKTSVPGAVAGDGDGTNVVVIAKGAAFDFYLSADNGATWSKSDKVLPATGSVALRFGNGCFFVAAKMDIIRSCDGGATWESVKDGAPMSGAFVDNPPQVLFATSKHLHGFFGTQLYRLAIQ